MRFLLYYGSAAQIIFVILVFGGGSVAGLCTVRKLVPLDRLQKNHEVAGVTFGVLGAFYGLVLAFVIVAAWERFNQANTDSLEEATALESLYKLGAAMSDPIRTRLDSEVLRYIHRVIDEEWPKMADDTYQGGKVGAHELWSIVLASHPADGREAMLTDKAIDELNIISQARSQRFLFYGDDLPSVVWTVIYLGCLMTIGFSYFFGSNVFRAQVMMCGFFSILLGMTILAILELAHPYQGVVTISNQPFRYALARMEATKDYKMTGVTPALSRLGRLRDVKCRGHPCHPDVLVYLHPDFAIHTGIRSGHCRRGDQHHRRCDPRAWRSRVRRHSIDADSDPRPPYHDRQGGTHRDLSRRQQTHSL